MLTTEQIQTLAAAPLEQVFAAVGQDLEVVTVTPPVNGWDEQGNQITAPPATQTVRGLLMPASDRRRIAAAGQNLPLPNYVAYLPFDAADLDVPRWYIRHGDLNYYPTRDAQDIGGQGVCWLLELGSPGEVMQGG